MKLDATDLRYISNDAFRVLAACEQGSKNHELVPTSLIAQLSGARSGGVNKALGELAKKKLVAKIQNAKYEGYRLTYGGYDFLACRTFAKRDTIYSVGNQIGTGKESDIYVVADDDGAQMVMKIHRLGRVSFRAIKSKRDYLRKGQSASWMYMSRLAAIKEYAFMTVLHAHGFPVPKPIDQSRHCLIMELIDAFPMRQIAHVPSPGELYSKLMDLIVRLARSGLIHGDFNEFNILIRDHRSEAEKDRDEETPEERDERILASGGDFPVVVPEEDITPERREKGILEPVLIDFPQMISTDHADAEYYFNRDVTCIRNFFSRRFKYESSMYPRFSAMLKDGVREFDLDVEVAASGFSKGERQVLEEYMAEIARNEEDEVEEEHSDDEGDDEEEDGAEVEGEEEEEQTGLGKLSLHDAVPTKKDALGNDVPVSDGDDEEHTAQEDNATAAAAGSDDEEDDSDDEDQTGSESDASDASDAPSMADTLAHRRHRPSAKRTTPDVTAIVTSKLSRQKRSTEKKHHGKKPASSNILGKGKGSKAKTDKRRQIKEGGDF